MTAFIVALLVSTVPSFAAAAGLVPCNGLDCSVCDIAKLLNNVIAWFIGFGAVLAIVVISYAGIKLVVSGGNQSALEHAKSMMFDVIIGFVILLCAYLIVDVFMRGLTGDGLNSNRWQIRCAAPPSLTSNTPSANTPSSGVVSSTGGARQCTDCVTTGSLPIKAGACAGQTTATSCSVSGALAPKLGALNTALQNEDMDWRITEAYPPTMTHQNSCHAAGTCVDANCATGACSAVQVKTFIASAEGAGLRPVYEVGSQGEYNTLKNMGIDTDNLAVVNRITAAHFSVYNQ